METQTSHNQEIQEANPPVTPRKSTKGTTQIHRPHQKRNSHDPALAKRPMRPLEMVPSGEAILTEIDRSRFLTNSQIGELLFRRSLTETQTIRADSTYQKFANRSIRDLLALGLIEKVLIYQTHRQTGKVFQDGVNILSSKGIATLRDILDRLDSDDRVRSTPGLREFSFRKIDHELAISNIRIALTRGVWSLGADCEVLCFYDDDQLKRLKSPSLFQDFIPDGWCVVETPAGLFPLFIEADRGTEPVKSTNGSTKDWYTKMARYSDYHALRYHDDPFYKDLEYDTREMRLPIILTLTTSAARQASLLEATAKAGGYGAYWFTTTAELFGTPDPDAIYYSPFGAILEPIWKRLKHGETIDLRSHLTNTST